VAQNETNRKEYVQKLLDAYRRTPGTTGRVSGRDRILAVKLQQQGVPLTVVENALVLAAARRLFRTPEALSLRTIRSLHYFLPIIHEVLELRVAQGYFQHLRNKIERSIKK
jgi:hypothetical protein